MSAFKSLLLLATLSISFAACNLEMAGPDVNPVYPPGTGPGTPPQDTSTTVTPPVGSAKIEGTWNFVGVTVKSATSQQESGATLKSTSEYTTSNNEGVFVFDGKNITITGLTYLISGTMKMTVIAPGLPAQEVPPTPINALMPPYDGVSPYKHTGANTIHMDEGFIGDPSGMGVTPTQGADATVVVDGDNLTMTIDLSKVVVPGVQVSGSQVAKFTRKK